MSFQQEVLALSLPFGSHSRFFLGELNKAWSGKKGPSLHVLPYFQGELNKLLRRYSESLSSVDLTKQQSPNDFPNKSESKWSPTFVVKLKRLSLSCFLALFLDSLIQKI